MHKCCRAYIMSELPIGILPGTALLDSPVRMEFSTGSCQAVFIQSAEDDKRIANISLFIYIGLPGLHPNKHQDLVASCHLTYTHTYIYILAANV